MRMLVIHDGDGNVNGVVTSPSDAPPIYVGTQPGEFVSEVEPPEGTIGTEALQPERILELLREYRVDARRAQLVTKQKL
jgi:hypothetical protein